MCWHCIASCAEGGRGGVVACLHAGLIPILSRDTSVDVNDDDEMVLEYSTIEEIKESVQNLSMNLSGRIARLNAGSRQR
jgi:hypothetical protein